MAFKQGKISELFSDNFSESHAGFIALDIIEENINIFHLVRERVYLLPQRFQFVV